MPLGPSRLGQSVASMGGGFGGSCEKVFDVRIFSSSLKQRCQVVCYPVLVQGSGEHGAVSSLPVGLEQASGRCQDRSGTFRSLPGKLDALGSVRFRECKFHFSEGL